MGAKKRLIARLALWAGSVLVLAVAGGVIGLLVNLDGRQRFADERKREQRQYHAIPQPLHHIAPSVQGEGRSVLKVASAMRTIFRRARAAAGAPQGRSRRREQRLRVDPPPASPIRRAVPASRLRATRRHPPGACRRTA